MTAENLTIKPTLQLVAWEITRGCNLFCAHCRASATQGPYENELSTEECFRVVDEIAQVGRPIIILSGGEPLLRQDVLSIARYAVTKGLRVVMGTNGTLITEQIASELKRIPVSRLAVSMDFPGASLQDEFRGKNGAFEAALSGIARARRAGIEVQINSTITRLNVSYLDELVSLALTVGAVTFHPFLLVPTGRGKDLKNAELSPQKYEETLNWIYDRQIELGGRMLFKPTCAPHFMRIAAQRKRVSGDRGLLPPAKTGAGGGHPPMHSLSRGCLAGTGFCFISHQGRVQGCGYLDTEAGNIRTQPLSQIWAKSPLFCELRNPANVKGKCGICEFKMICGGCRARAYEATGDYLETEPYCIYEPALSRRGDLDAKY